MDIKEFFELTQLSKNEIIAGKLCKRFVHRGDWKQKVIDYKDSYTSDSDVVKEALELSRKRVKEN